MRLVHRSPKTEPPEESRAAAIVEAVTACRTCWLDRGDEVQRPDYALVDGSGQQIGVLEVTALSSASHNSFFSNNAAKHRSWKDPSLRWNWRASVDSASRELRTLRRPLAASLPALEAEGVRFASSQPANFRGPVAVIPAQLKALGIVELTAFGPEVDGGAVISINVMPDGGAYGVESDGSAGGCPRPAGQSQEARCGPFPPGAFRVGRLAVGSRGHPEHVLCRPLAIVSGVGCPAATTSRGERCLGSVVVGRPGLPGKRPVARER